MLSTKRQKRPHKGMWGIFGQKVSRRLKDMLDYVESLSGGKLLRPSFGRICVLEMLSAKSEKKPLRWFRRWQITLIPKIASIAQRFSA